MLNSGMKLLEMLAINILISFFQNFVSNIKA